MNALKRSPEHLAKLRAGARAYRAARPAEVRFWEKVDKDQVGAGCWEWIGAVMGRGYGTFNPTERPSWLAHRYSWFMAHGRIPRHATSGLVIDHQCYNPRCVNPAHLRLIPQSDNCGIYAPGAAAYRNVMATHCKRGHPLTGENVARILVLGRSKARREWRSARHCLTCYPHYRNHPRRFYLLEDLTQC